MLCGFAALHSAAYNELIFVANFGNSKSEYEWNGSGGERILVLLIRNTIQLEA